MPKNPIVDAILEAGKKAVESARRTFQGEFHTGHLSPEHVHLPNDRQRPRLLTPEELRRREQVRAAEDQAVFDALDGIAANPRRRLTPQDLLGMTPEQRNEAVVTQAALDIQDDIDADILRTLEAQSLASPGLIPGTVNIQAPLQVSHIVPNPNSLYDAVPQAQVGMLQALTREDIDRFRREIEQYDLQVTPPPIGIPGRMEGELAVDRVNVDRENLFRLFQQGNLSVDTIQEMFNLDVPPEPRLPDPGTNIGIGVYNPRGISRLELYRHGREVTPEALVQAGRSERPSIQATERVLEAIRAGERLGVSMGTRVEHRRVPDRDVGRTGPTFIEPSWVATPAMPPNIDGPTPNWVNNAADPNAVVAATRAERVIFPTFEMAANPTVPITEIRARRFDLIDRDSHPDHTDYTQDIPSAALHKEPHRYEGPRPSVWEKITGDELIDDPFAV